MSFFCLYKIKVFVRLK